MKKLFGEYLIEKGIVDEATLAGALLEQTRSLPSYAEIVYEKKLISAKQLLDVFKAQNEKQLGFVEASKSLGFWNDEIDTEITNAISKVRVPLGKILIQMKAAPLEKISVALDEFLAQFERESQQPEPAVEPVAVPMVEPGVEAAEADEESEAIFEDAMTAERRTILENLFTTFKAVKEGAIESESIGGSFIEAIEAVRVLKGAARLAQLETKEKILTTLESTFVEMSKQNPKEIKPEVMNKLSELSARL